MGVYSSLVSRTAYENSFLFGINENIFTFGSLVLQVTALGNEWVRYYCKDQELTFVVVLWSTVVCGIIHGFYLAVVGQRNTLGSRWQEHRIIQEVGIKSLHH